MARRAQPAAPERWQPGAVVARVAMAEPAAPEPSAAKVVPHSSTARPAQPQRVARVALVAIPKAALQAQAVLPAERQLQSASAPRSPAALVRQACSHSAATHNTSSSVAAEATWSSKRTVSIMTGPAISRSAMT